MTITYEGKSSYSEWQISGRNAPVIFGFVCYNYMKYCFKIRWTKGVYYIYYGISRFMSWYWRDFIAMIISKGEIQDESKENRRIPKTTS